MILYQIQVLKFKAKHYFTAFWYQKFPIQIIEKKVQILIVTTEEPRRGYKNYSQKEKKTLIK